MMLVAAISINISIIIIIIITVANTDIILAMCQEVI